MAAIKQIEQHTIHRIQSGQVIVDIGSVVKELVENSFDAGATIVDIRFRNQGLDAIEVQDNGAGIEPRDFESVALKHHTSKLGTYTDIASLTTFGFRGEALSSVCALAQLTIITCRAEDVPKGSKLEFEPSGKLKNVTVVAAQRGTTVAVERLFHNLPVRRRELERNIKREWTKVITLLNQYACIQTGVKFTASQQPTKGKRIVLFSTAGNRTVRDNVMNIYGTRALASLMPVDVELDLVPTVAQSVQPGVVGPSLTGTKQVGVRGLVSRPAHGEGRQTPDRQMFYVNGRPCALPQFGKVFNEAYRTYNSNQSPFILADIQLDTNSYDVNVSPDKRTILLHDQGTMLDALREALATLFERHGYAVQVNRTLTRAHTMRDIPTKVVDIAKCTDIFAAASIVANAQPVCAPLVGRSPTNNTPIDYLSTRDGLQAVSDEENSGPSIIDVDYEEQPGRPLCQTRSSNLRKSSPRTSTIPRSSLTPHTSSIFDAMMNRPCEISSDITRRPRSYITNRNPRSPDTMSAPSTSDKHHVLIPAHNLFLPSSATESNESDSAGAKHSHKRPKWIHQVPSRDGCFDIDSGSTGSSQSPGLPTLMQKKSANTTVECDTDSPIGSPTGRASESGPDARGQSFNQLEISRTQTALVNLPASPPQECAPQPRAVERKPLLPRQRSVRQRSTDMDLACELTTGAVIAEQPTEGLACTQPIPTGNDDKAPVYHQVKTGGRTKAKHPPLMLSQDVITNESSVCKGFARWKQGIATAPKSSASQRSGVNAGMDTGLDVSVGAEERLTLIISKSDFSRMRVVGQFNLGFILVVKPAFPDLGEPTSAMGEDLFIIDQHASDEKYNFERLQAQTGVQSQRLVRSKLLDLTAVQEEIVLNNMDAIEANGFKIEVDDYTDTDANPEIGRGLVGSRCRLSALPLSKDTTFAIDDLEELIHLLGERQSVGGPIPRPAKVRKMFAMRACRSSIMIGKALTHTQMVRVVRHMGELDKPWNCPHGRPTMRHLTGMRLWDTQCWKEPSRRRPIVIASRGL